MAIIYGFSILFLHLRHLGYITLYTAIKQFSRILNPAVGGRSCNRDTIASVPCVCVYFLFNDQFVQQYTSNNGHNYPDNDADDGTNCNVVTMWTVKNMVIYTENVFSCNVAWRGTSENNETYIFNSTCYVVHFRVPRIK